MKKFRLDRFTKGEERAFGCCFAVVLVLAVGFVLLRVGAVLVMGGALVVSFLLLLAWVGLCWWVIGLFVRDDK